MSVVFSFDGIMYWQTDEAYKGFPFGTRTGKYFCRFPWKGFTLWSWKPEVYFRYVYDTFCLFNNEMEADLFFTFFNNIHPGFKFTLEMDDNFTFPFLDVLVCWTTSCFLALLYNVGYHLPFQHNELFHLPYMAVTEISLGTISLRVRPEEPFLLLKYIITLSLIPCSYY